VTKPPLLVTAAPHLAGPASTPRIMWHVVLSLLPVWAAATWFFGPSAVLVVLAATAGAVLVERLAGRPGSLADGSGVITGLLLGLTLPPGLPLWMAFLGGVFAIAFGKLVFGGLGQNPFNPALVGRATLQAAFPVSMTSWLDGFGPGRFSSLPSSTLTFLFASPVYDAVSGATPLAAWKFDHTTTSTSNLAMGMTSGSAGETSALLIGIGGAYLIARNMMNWRIPAAVLGAAVALSAALHFYNPEQYASPALMLFSGGLMLGATFMASDMVGSPMTNLGCWIYGAFIGAIVIVIRAWGAMPEGVMYAILLGNAISPQIDRLIQPRIYGARAKETAA
jgi:electron transport complex protein RnfD